MPGDELILLLAVGPTPPRSRLRPVDKTGYPPLGLLSLEALLRAHGCRTLLIDLMRRDWHPDLLRNEVAATGADPILAGVSTFTESSDQAYRIGQAVKALFPRCALVVGGPHVSFMPEEALRAGADFVVLFEGESTLVSLLEHVRHPRTFPVEQIPGVAYLRDGELVSNGRRPPIRRLDELPFSPRILSCQEGELRTNLLTSRGCPGRCIFCASGAFSGHLYRRHSSAYVVSLMYFAMTRLGNPARFGFVDDCFTVDRRRLSQVFDCLDSNGIGVEWDGRCRVDQLDPEFVSDIARRGCCSLHLGVESAEQSVLDAIGKGISLDGFLAQFEHMIRVGIWPRCSFIIGHHCDTLSSIEKTLMLAATIEMSGLGAVAVGVSTPFPGTVLREKATSLGAIIGQDRWSSYTLVRPVYSTKEVSVDEVRRALHLFHTDKRLVARGGFLVKNGPPLEDSIRFRQRIEQWASRLSELKSGTVHHDPGSLKRRSASAAPSLHSRSPQE